MLQEGFFLSEWHEFITPPTPDRTSDSVRFFRISAADDAAEHVESSALLKKKKIEAVGATRFMSKPCRSQT